ncbi:MAG: tetratricopeptide repeat protein, partial [Minisyncoccia bacterium]
MKKNTIFIFLLMGIISGITGIILGLITHYLSKFDYYIVTNYPNSTSLNTTNTSLDITVTSSPIEINTSTIKNDLENGKTDKAYNEAKNYFEKHPNDYWGCQLLGNSLFQLQKYSEAITIFQKCITLAPSKNELG